MRLRVLSVLVVLTVAAACEATSTSDGPGPQGISPQPQPNRREAKFTSPCTASQCGDAPGTLEKPRCAPREAGCVWDEDTPVSYRPCADSECGTAPGPDVCPTGTTFNGNTCGSENDAACAWNTVCAPPPSTTPCTTADACGGKPEIGVICKDGGTGDLVCMQFDSSCRWQRTCDEGATQ